MSVGQFAICLGLGWGPDVMRVQFGLEEKCIVEISEIIGKMRLNEVIALMVAFGQQRLVAWPMMILAELVAESNLDYLFSYLLMTRGDIPGLTTLAELLKKEDAQEQTALL